MQSMVRSGVSVPDITQIAEELVLNAIDANAHAVEVRVDMGAFRLQVADDGDGIAFSDLRLVGERYCTSKVATLDQVNASHLKSHGYRGEALASIRDVAILDISTRVAGSAVTYSKVMKGTEYNKVEISDVSRSTPGTTVAAHDIFYNMPVRRKRLNASLVLDHIRRKLESLALLNISVGMTLINEQTGTRVLHTKPSKDMKYTFLQLFGATKAGHLRRTEAISDDGPARVHGYMAVEAHHSNNLQFVFINGRVAARGAPISKMLAALFASSVICRKTELKYDTDVPSTRHCSSRHGVFCVNIAVPMQFIDVTTEPDKSAPYYDTTLTEHLIKGLFALFIEKYCTLLNDADMTVTAVLSCPHADTEPSGDGLQLDTTTVNDEARQTYNKESIEEEMGDSLDVEAKMPYEPAESMHCSTTPATLTNLSKYEFQYKARDSKIVTSTIARRASSANQAEHDGFTAKRMSQDPDENRHCIYVDDCKYIHDGDDGNEGSDCEWSSDLDEELSQPTVYDMSSSVHQAIEQASSSLFDSGPVAVARTSRIVSNTRCDIPRVNIVAPMKFTREMFQQLKFVRQVDDKFLLCLLTPADRSASDHPVVLMIDQHAAHERVRLEQLERDLYDEDLVVKSHDVVPPLSLQMDSADIRQMKAFRAQLLRWGVAFDADASDVTHTTAVITRLPVCIAAARTAEGAVAYGNLVTTFIQEELDVLRHTSGGSQSIPRTIMYLLATRACHGAIRFGDSLSHARCLELIDALSKCKFPWQCAHGRPSLVPVVDLKLLCSS